MSDIAQKLKKAYDGYLTLQKNEADVPRVESQRNNLQNKSVQLNIALAALKKELASAERNAGALQTSIEENESKLAKMREELEATSNFETINIEADITAVHDNMNNKITEAEADTEKSESEAASRKYEQLGILERKFEKDSDKLEAESSFLRGSNSYEQTSLNFHQEELAINDMHNNKVNDENKKMNSANATANVEIKKLKQNRTAVIAEAEPHISQEQTAIDKVLHEFAPEVNSKETLLNNANSELDVFNDESQLKRYNIEVFYQNEMESINNLLQQTDADFVRQIRIAESEGRATTRLRSSRESKLASLRKDYLKSQNKLAAELRKHDLAYDKDVDVLVSRRNSAQKPVTVK